MKFASVVAALLLMCAAGFASGVQAAHPKVNNHELLLPSNYRSWVVLSSATAGMHLHRHKHLANKLYVEPGSYEHFTKTGQWPDRTVIVLELMSERVGAAARSDVMGLEAAVKDETHFPEAWSYYGIVFDRTQTNSAPVKAEKMCDCEQPLDAVLAMAFPALRAIINAKPATMPSTLF
jgi:hypothetical protein